ncbi:MAG: DNA polymerase/3'-5' exonuclease PolX [Candidatus Methylarchaceae archaeon HK02M2]|nr:DNA polymerase/3'-5' exonuclease PolX [Candidatus Methylarchaceae archaeon HK02M2]
MKNLKVAKILNEIADLLELKDVEFKPRAYRKAAISVKSLSKDIEEVKEEGKLKELPGVGENIAKKIEELIDTGSLKYYEDLKKEFPIDFESLLAVEGLGPKTIKILYKKLSIKNLDDLERAAKKHKIRELGGLGKKTEEKILANIKFARKKKERNLLGYIIPISENLRNELNKSKFVDKVEITGSIRRKKETIRDIDILVITKKPEKIMDFFTSYDGVIRVVAKGKSKSTVKLKEGIQSDLRVIERKSFGAALMYFTGSKEFNVEMRRVAIKKGLKLNEYGLFKDGKQKVGKTEEEIFQRLGMTYIEPELRENRGEIEAALEGKIPKLIGYNELKGDLQMHSKWSDGSHTIEEMAKAAKGLGHEYIAITDHTGTLRIAKGMDEITIRKQMKEIEEVDERINGLTVLKGVEVNIDSEGKLDIKDKVLKNLDVVVASIHSGFRQGKEKITKRIISAMDNENVDIIAHPTGRKIQERAGYDLDFEKVFEKSIETNTFLEINSYPNRLDLNDINVKRALEFGCKLVINTDSHSIEHLRYLNLGIATARRGWAKKDNIINTLPIKKLLKLFS